MTIVVTGGGSGGHITPLLAVATEIKKQSPSDTRIVYIGQKGDRFAKIVAAHDSIDETKYIFAGKFRRYHGEGIRQILDIKTIALNLRDMFFVLIGTFQSIALLFTLKPSKVFIKGGFVGVPIGLAAALWRIPYITHDSDALAGLANKIVAKWATLHAVALPKENYSYPKSKTVTVGVPTSSEYIYVTKKLCAEYRHELALPDDAKVVVVTGGGLGAQNINSALTSVAGALLDKYPELYIFHFTGHTHIKTVNNQYKKLPQSARLRVHALDYTDKLHVYTGSADVVITRAGATNMAELAQQGKACIVAPNPVLAGGHQLKNARAYESKKAVFVIEEQKLNQNPEDLASIISKIIDDPKLRDELGDKLHKFAYSSSASQLAQLLLADKPQSLVN